MTVIKKAFRMALFPYQLIKENRANYIEMPKHREDPQIPREKLKIISMDQYKQILKLVPRTDRFYIPLQIAFNTGLRRGEVCGLEWNAVNLEDHTITVNQAMMSHGSNGKSYESITPKTKASYRTIMIGQSLVDILKWHHKDQLEQRLRYGEFYTQSNFVCTAENGQPVTPNNIKNDVERIQKHIDFPFNFHSLRHTHATMLLENGTNIKEIQARLGHSRIATTMDTYSHITRKMREETVDIFEKMMHDAN